jgi:predicted DNA-binding transcriptional regulator AlpA
MREPILEARIWKPTECAARLNKSVPWFYSHKRRLEQLGMPKRDKELGGWDSKAFETWLDSRSGMNGQSDVEQEMLGAIHGNR